jgi:cell division transport system ATP-binding protein
MLRFSNVTKVYPRGGTALDDVSFSLRRGEFAFLTGSSGAGKSTLLKLIFMEERPTSGEVLVGTTSSVDVKRRDIPQLRRRLGIVFQDFRLLETRTAEQNVAFALEVTGAPRASIPTKVARVLQQVGLAAKATAYPGELSGGEQQRVAIARALVNDPFLLIADEPTGNLDERSTRSVFQLLKDISTAGTAVVMATHDMQMVRSAPFRNIELDHGRIVRDTGDLPGTPAPDPLLPLRASQAH